MSGGFFMAPEAIVADLGPAQAVLYGRIWRYCQGGGACYASIATLAGECGVSRPTVCRWIGELVDTGYITRQSGQAAGKTSVLVTTRKWVAGGVSEVDRGADQNLTGGVYQNLTTKRRLEDKTKDVWTPEAGAHNTPEETPPAAAPPQLAKPERKARPTKAVEPGMLDAIRAMVDTMEVARGYPVANYARHTRPAKRLILMGHTPDDVRRTVDYIKRECKHLDGQPLTMETVSKYIGIVASKPKARPIPVEQIDWLELV